MTAGNGQGFIIINLRACIRIYAAALSPSRLPPNLSLSLSFSPSPRVICSDPLVAMRETQRTFPREVFLANQRLSLSCRAGTGDTRVARIKGRWTRHGFIRGGEYESRGGPERRWSAKRAMDGSSGD